MKSSSTIVVLSSSSATIVILALGLGHHRGTLRLRLNDDQFSEVVNAMSGLVLLRHFPEYYIEIGVS